LHLLKQQKGEGKKRAKFVKKVYHSILNDTTKTARRAL
jgi:hypothetical protein